MDKKFDYLKAYFIFCIIVILYLIRILLPELAPKLGWKASGSTSHIILIILIVTMYILYFIGFKDIASKGFLQYILFTFTISLGFGSALLVATLISSSHWKMLYAIFCVIMLITYGEIYKRSNPYVSTFSNILIALVINNMILLNTIIWKASKLKQVQCFLSKISTKLSGELIINLVLFPVLLMTSYGAFISAKTEYYNEKKKYQKKEKEIKDKRREIISQLYKTRH